MAARIDIPSVYDEVRKAYAGMGYPVSGDRLVLSEQPTYTNGKPVPADVMLPEVSGGNTQDDGTVRINPNYRSVMKHWGLKGIGRDFLRLIIGHELGHHVDRTLLRTRARSAERRRLLREISRSGFHTVYTDSYGPDTDPRKLDKELLAEYLARQVSGRLEKQAGKKLPTSIETVRKLIGALKRKGLKRVSIAEIFASRPKYSLFRGSNALPAHAHRVPVKGEFARNLVDGVRYEHYTPFPESAHDYGRYLTVTDISKEKGLMSGRRGLTSDFHAMDEARMAASDPKRKALFGQEYTKFITEHPEDFSELHGITRGGDGKLKSILKPSGGGVRDNFFETTIPARYADKHSKVYMAVPGESPYRELTLENGGLFIPPKSFLDEYRRLNPGSSYTDIMAERGVINKTRPFSTNRDYHFYDMSPIQRLVKIMHRHPEYRSEIEPVVSKYLGIDKSYMAGL